MVERPAEETWHKLYQQALDRENAVTAERARLAADNARLREALEPFANVASVFSFAVAPDGIDDGLAIIAHAHVRPNEEAVLSTSNFSAAYNALWGKKYL